MVPNPVFFPLFLFGFVGSSRDPMVATINDWLGVYTSAALAISAVMMALALSPFHSASPRMRAIS